MQTVIFKGLYGHNEPELKYSAGQERMKWAYVKW